MSEIRYWVGFDHIKGLGHGGYSKLRAAFPSMEAAWLAPERELQSAGFGRDLSASVVKQRDALALDEVMENLARQQVVAIPRGSDGYPAKLNDVEKPPNVLYLKGELTDGDLSGVTVVGTRSCSNYGKSVCVELSRELAKRGVTVISDMVRGIDAIAHRSALDAGGRTVAVMASGLDQTKSSSIRSLAMEIFESRSGCLISEHPPGIRPHRSQLRLRNRLLSGLAAGVLVIEAPKKSGTMLTVRCALDQGREVLAVPGRADSTQSEGTNWLISQGAKVVTNVDDILEVLPDAVANYRSNASGESRLRDVSYSNRSHDSSSALNGRGRSRNGAIVVETAEERRIVDCVMSAGRPLNVNEIAIETGIPLDKLGASLSMMEIKGCLRKVGTGFELADSGQHLIAPLLQDGF